VFETLLGRIKREWIHHAACHSHEQANQPPFEDIEAFLNVRRLQVDPWISQFRGVREFPSINHSAPNFRVETHPMWGLRRARQWRLPYEPLPA
jgi:hypothetical protein